MAARIVGVGQKWAGDDGVGLAVIKWLRRALAPVDLAETAEPTQLVDLLTDGADPVVLVDAILDGGAAGRVRQVDYESRDRNSKQLLSTHGLDVIAAIELARGVYPDRVASRVFIVGITIRSAGRGTRGLSAAVENAVPIAAAHALNLANC
jgi:hydrogenase maturation protease